MRSLSFRAALSGLAVLSTTGAALAQLRTAESAVEPAASAERPAIVPRGTAPTRPRETPEQALESATGLVSRAHAALRALERVRARSAISPELERLQSQMLDERDSLAERVKKARDGVQHARLAFELRDIRFSFLEDRRRIAAWQKLVTRANRVLTENRKQTNELGRFWQRANQLAEESGAPAALRDRTREIVEAARVTELALAKPEAVLIPLQSTLTEMEEMVNALLDETATERPQLIEDAHRHDLGVADAVSGLGEIRHARAAATRTLTRMRDMGRLFLSSARKELLAHVAFTLLAVVGMLGLRAQSRDWKDDEREGKVARRIAKHPLAGALLLCTVASIFIYEDLPTVVVISLYVIAIVSSAVLWLPLVGQRSRSLGYLLAGFVCLDLARILLVDLVHVERVILLAELIVFTLVLLRMLRANALNQLAESDRTRAFLRGMAWFWLLGAGLGFLAGLVGYGYVAEIVGGGVLASVYLAVLFSGMAQALASVSWVVTQTAWARKLHFVRMRPALVVRTFSTLFAWLALFLWLRGSLKALTIYEALGEAGATLLAKTLEIGALKISLGTIAVLVLGTVLAVVVARTLRFVLDQDLWGRFDMSAGTREVAGSGVFWAAILLGFFAVLAAAGIALDKLTVLAGAFGVGIGFGMQNIVQNFAAGLILLFGRPIKVGDNIQLADLVGEVRTIGFRASTVRTAQGAEVIVPNAKLISDQVINWTLSDPKRRIELDIGVAYGTDPARVVEILCEVGRSHGKVLDDPPVMALFLSHGDSALRFQLRAWTIFDDFGEVSSELAIAVNKRLTAEGIAIPFPQRDLHLRSVSPEASDALRAASPRPSTK